MFVAVLLVILLPISVHAENMRPEILSLTWDEEQDGVLITFRKNGIDGSCRIIGRFGSVDEPMHGGGANEVDLPGEVVEFCWRTSDLVPGETYSFAISMLTPDRQEICSEEKDCTIPIFEVQSPIEINECVIPDLSFSKLKEMQDRLIGYVLEGDFQSYMAVCNDLYDSAVTASLKTSGIVRVLLTAPGGQMTVFDAGNSPYFEVQDDYYDFAHNLAEEFVSPLWIERGRYTLRFYDWERKCLIGTCEFNVV